MKHFRPILLLAAFTAGSCLAADTDLDGIPDHEDPWPGDGSKPVISQLWGVGGELWSADSRLPFVGFAGYRDGNDPIPEVTRIVANVLAFGATGATGSGDDTQAFLDAIAHAETQVSETNPGAILVPAGVYDVSAELHLNKSGLVLQGEGRDLSEIRFTYTGDAKGVVMGSGGLNWQYNQFQSDFNCRLDTTQMPQLGDFTLHLASPMTQTFQDHLAAQGNRARIAQWINRAASSATPQLVENIYGGPLGSAASGHSTLAQECNVTIVDDQTLQMDRPLRWTPTTEMLWNQPVLVSLRDTAGTETQELGIEDLTIRFQAPSFVPHNGIGENGIEVDADHSWVRRVRVINADHAIGIDQNRAHVTVSDAIVDADRSGSYYGPGVPYFYRVYGHVGIGINGYDNLVRDFEVKKSYIHDVSTRHSMGCVIMNGSAVEMNMDHHRQTIYGNVWTNLNLGSCHRMWDSTGDGPEGYQCAAYNTWWNISSDNPEDSVWPAGGNWIHGVENWGYYKQNYVGMGLTEKPQPGSEIYEHELYVDSQVHHEGMPAEELWPRNIYLAQREAYLEGRLWAPAVSNSVPVADAHSTSTPEDVTLDMTLTGSDADGDNLSFVVESAPANGTLSGTAPNLSYTPNANFHGVDSFTFTVSDEVATSTEATVSITVISVDDDPVFSSDPITGNAATPGVAYAGSIVATDGDGDSLTYRRTFGPPWLTVSSSGTLGGIPGPGDVGPNSFTVEVDDGHGGFDSATLEINVTSVAALEQWDFNEADGTALSGTGNSGTVGTAWQGANTTWVTDGSGALTLSGAIGNNWIAGTEHYSPYLTDPGKFSFEVTIASWTHDAAAVGNALKCRIVNDYGGSEKYLAEIDFKMEATGAKATLISGHTNYRDISLGGLSGGPVTLRVDFDMDDGTAEYFLNNSSQHVFDNLDTDLMSAGIRNIKMAREGGWTSPNSTLSVDRITLSLEGMAVAVDSDGDGLTDAQELALGTDPDDPGSVFAITGLTLNSGSGEIEITWPSATGVLYRVWQSPDLVNWSVARDWAPAGAPPADTLGIDLTPTRLFFRVEADIQ